MKTTGGSAGSRKSRGVNCQERSRKELLETLKITLREALEFNKQDALNAAGSNFHEENDL